ncbi:MAG TPA: hypothetical protein DCZ95_06880 [Verrucomicrobia bacterium]|nr:MAG: hypothetical protein A2X46_06105 [Lentisphaerae bacterium GWF2_57_35]HBA83799.1 hypothetical protein [Verrucomicrobiota bacterium]
MPNILSALKQEIQRLARKEVRAAFLPLKKEIAGLKHTVRELRQQTQLLEKQTRTMSKTSGMAPQREDDQEARRVRITSKGMKSLRRKLKLTQAEFAQLLGVSGQSVWQWEKKTGAVRLRNRTRQALMEIRDLGAREVRQRLEQPKS